MNCHEVLEAHGGNKTLAALALGLKRSTFRHRLKAEKRDGLDIPDLPDPHIPIEDLVEERKRKFKHKHEAEEARKLIHVKVRDPKPIGITVFGDPHIDDDGCDIAQLERDAKIVRDTEGLWGLNIGDSTNNWAGRLAKLYSEQSTSQSEAWRLAEWFLGMVPWLAIIGGNHDGWSGAGDPLRWILKHCTYEPFQARIALDFPSGKQIVINARHDFAGHSMWNPAHGPMKAAQMGFRDHVLIAGHKHQSGYGLIKCPSTGRVNHAIRVASYKIHDRYGKQLGLPDQNIAPCVTIILRPEADERGMVTVFHDIEAGAEYLTWLRNRTATT